MVYPTEMAPGAHHRYYSIPRLAVQLRSCMHVFSNPKKILVAMITAKCTCILDEPLPALSAVHNEIT